MVIVACTMCTRPLLVLISGKRGAGKDYFAKLVKECNDHVVHVVPTSKFVKLDYCERFDCSYARLQEDRTYKEQHRGGLIGWAEHQKTRVSPTVWIERSLIEYRQLARNATQPLVIAVPDFRFQIEWEYLMQHAADEFCIKTVRIDAPADIRVARGAWPIRAVDTHASETELDEFEEFTYLVTNDSSPDGDTAMLLTAQLVLDMEVD